MNIVTSRPAASGPSATPRRSASAAGPGVAPQPRLDPTDRQVEVEPTTGAPVDAVPRRVPVREPRWQRGAVSAGNWAPIEEVHWDGTPLRDEPRRRHRRPPARRVPPRPPLPPNPPAGLAALLALSLLATFFAWVSVGPLWLAVGHSSGGTVMITECVGNGLTQRCRGIFQADRDRFQVQGVRVSGVPTGSTVTGSVLPARMTGPDGATAYADTGAGRHLRWMLGLAAVVGCAAGIARWTGATRLTDDRQRRRAVLLALAGPLLLTLGFLAAAW
ncbi:hypothetical protein [Micromonospora sp. DT31]|uniref:hypothetical protein n=1 Tax=Micromonospora sp. DT31 TaxID=3393434 RepID=UPI003CEBFBFE